MLVSIITVCYNSENYVKDAIESVISQSYPNIEYILIDGGSQDRTVEIIHSYKSNIHKLVSEPDYGIYDAMNKGIELSTGDIIGILNSDDYYKDITVIERVVRLFEKYNTDCVYANIDYVDPNKGDKIVRKWVSGEYTPNSFKEGWHPAHPAFFVKKGIFNQYGKYDLSYKLAADFELMLRFVEKYKISNYYLPESLINMRLGGATNKSLINILKQNIECFRAFKKNNLEVSIFYPILRLLPKIHQFFKKK